MTVPKSFGGLAMAGLLSVAAGAGLSAACGSDGTGATADDAGSPADGRVLPTGDAGPDDDGDGHDPFNGQDAGCPVTVDGPRSGVTAVSVPRSGAAGLAWASPEGARAIDSQLARATLDLGQATEHLRITGFGFTVPATAKIIGVEVELKRQASDTGIADGNIELWLDGAPSDRPKFVASSWPSTIVGTHHYGQAIDTWGNDLTPALINGAGFGVELYAQRQEDAGTGAVEARVESMRITVFYCP